MSILQLYLKQCQEYLQNVNSGAKQRQMMFHCVSYKQKQYSKGCSTKTVDGCSSVGWATLCGRWIVITALSLCSVTVLWTLRDKAFELSGLTIWILCWLNAHVRLALVQSGLPLTALLFQSCFRPAFCIDIGQVGWRVVIGLQALIIFNLQWKRWQEWQGNRKRCGPLFLSTTTR